MTGGRKNGDAPRALIIIQNLHVPFDRRVWLECQTLRDDGWSVTVVCPRGPDSRPHEVIDGVEVFTYRPYAPGGGALGFVVEYLYSFATTLWLVLRARRRGGAFALLQACNPPDIFWPIAWLLRRRDGTRFLFDHHDLCPELYQSRFGRTGDLAHRGLLLLERATFRTADAVTSTNESYARIARERGGKRDADVTVVRTGPDSERLQPVGSVAELRRGHRHLVAYIGVMGPQDGVDLALAAAAHIINDRARDDIAFTFMGAGDCWPDLVAERDRLELQAHVEFTGRVPDDTVIQVLSTADVGLCPDPKNALNDASTMNKTMEYMAFALPVVAFDLHETAVSAGDAAVYAAANDVTAFAEQVIGLLDDPGRREAMGKLGRERVVKHLAWEHQQAGYLAACAALLGRGAHASRTRAGTASLAKG
ncbi:glycosyltransferase family 4 protein [Mumia sp. zg.B21]|uniref:glycosyltransferase family 4 protein n=1 Tax=Mumia sp. zg.B21 TaxID=2855447 RepID=UPI001C6E4531|nr:glycosyltransferase family 4 protein [Mumia sp. zg.B21]MBW9210776.1 glycosyltransferase family 4 protein [Mumia sp. zg.B21]